MQLTLVEPEIDNYIINLLKAINDINSLLFFLLKYNFLLKKYSNYTIIIMLGECYE